MRILVDVGHPSHYLLFRNVIKILHERGDQTLIVVRNRENIVTRLLEADRQKYYLLAKKVKAGVISKALGLIINDIKIWRIARTFKPDLFLSMGSPYAGQVAFIMRKPHVSFDDTEVSKITMLLSAPFSTVIITPKSFKSLFRIKNHITVDSIKPIAYLSPKYFSPNPSVLLKMGLKEKERFVVVRFSSYDASHDFGLKGMSANSRDRLLRELSKLARIYETSEIDISPKSGIDILPKVPPEEIHDLLGFAALYVGEGSTMAAEAAILGVPSIIIHRNWAGILDELEKEGLLKNFHRPDDDLDEIIALCKKILEDPSLKIRQKERSDEFIRRQEDLVDIIVKEIDRRR